MSNLPKIKKLFYLATSPFRPPYTVADGTKLPPPHQRFCGHTFMDDQAYLQSADQEAHRIIENCNHPAEGAMLDLGSGQGRIAIGLARNKKFTGTYQGVDVHERSVRWCQQHISANNPSFTFQHLDLYNERYNPTGKIALDETLRLPFDDQSFDTIYLYSVFSHLRSPAIRHFLADFKRLLKPRGCLFFTGFIEEHVDDEAENPAAYQLNWKGPLHCVRFSKTFLASLLDEAGFTIRRFDHANAADNQSSVYVEHSS